MLPRFREGGDDQRQLLRLVCHALLLAAFPDLVKRIEGRFGINLRKFLRNMRNLKFASLCYLWFDDFGPQEGLQK